MNEGAALRRGYRYSGYYSYNHSEVVVKQDEIKNQGFKSVVVEISDSPIAVPGRSYSLGIRYALYVKRSG